MHEGPDFPTLSVTKCFHSRPSLEEGYLQLLVREAVARALFKFEFGVLTPKSLENHDHGAHRDVSGWTCG